MRATRTKAFVSLAFALLLCATVAVSAQSDDLCRRTFAGVGTYDLWSVAASKGAWSVATSGYTWTLQLCGTTTAGSCPSYGASFCQSASRRYGPFGLATWTTSPGAVPAAWTSCSDANCGWTGVQISFANGDPTFCSANRRTILRIECGATSSSTYTVSESPTCTYTVTFSDPAGCVIPPPSNSGSGSAGIAVVSSTGAAASNSSGSVPGVTGDGGGILAVSWQSWAGATFIDAAVAVGSLLVVFAVTIVVSERIGSPAAAAVEGH